MELGEGEGGGGGFPQRRGTNKGLTGGRAALAGDPAEPEPEPGPARGLPSGKRVDLGPELDPAGPAEGLYAAAAEGLTGLPALPPRCTPVVCVRVCVRVCV